eukprot:s357_g29.t1
MEESTVWEGKEWVEMGDEGRNASCEVEQEQQHQGLEYKVRTNEKAPAGIAMEVETLTPSECQAVIGLHEQQLPWVHATPENPGEIEHQVESESDQRTPW